MPAARKRFQDILDTPRFYGLIMADGRNVIGAVFGNIERCYDGYHYNLKEMFVQPELQGSGLGTEMMTKVPRDLGKKNVIGRVSLFYTRNSFKKVKGMQMMSLKFGQKGR